MKNKYLFAAIASAVVLVPAVTAPIPNHAATTDTHFKDVPPSHPYYSVIQDMKEKGIVSGYGDNVFGTSDKISKKHAAALINRAISLPNVAKYQKFRDVSERNAYYHDIKKLQQAGIVSPDAKGNYNPNEILTRAEMAEIITRAFELEVKSKHDFIDVPATHASSQFIRALYSNGITTGDGGYFKPNESLTRSHFTLFMHRALNLDENHVSKPIKKPDLVASMTMKDLEKHMKKNKLFKNVKLFPEVLKEHPEINRLVIKDQDILLNSGMRVIDTLGGIITLSSDEYKGNPALKNRLNELEVVGSIENKEQNYLSINLDFRSEKARLTAVEIFESILPGANLSNQILQKTEEAAAAWEIEKDVKWHKREFQGNGEFFKVDNYRVKILGGNPRLEFSQISIEPWEDR